MPSDPLADSTAPRRNRATLIAAVQPLLMPDTAAAALLGVSRAHFHRLRAAGKFGPPAIRLGRKVVYERSAIGRWVRAGCPDAVTWRAMEGQARRLRAV
jgi:predicted DNA-binding transcriptional regulator AlpA